MMMRERHAYWSWVKVALAIFVYCLTFGAVSFEVEEAFAFSPNTNRVVVILQARHPIDWLQVLQPNDPTWHQVRRDRIYQEGFGGTTTQTGFLDRQWHEEANDIEAYFSGTNGSAFRCGIWQKVGHSTRETSRQKSIRMWGSGVNRTDHPQYGLGWVQRLAAAAPSVFVDPFRAWDLGVNNEAFRGGSYVPARIYNLSSQNLTFQQYGGSEFDHRVATAFNTLSLFGFDGPHAARLSAEGIAGMSVQDGASMAGNAAGNYSGYDSGRILSASETILNNFTQTNLIIGTLNEFDTYLDQRDYYNNDGGPLRSLDNDISRFLSQMEAAGLQNNVVLVLLSDSGRQYGGSGFVDTTDTDNTDLRGTNVIGGPGDAMICASNVRTGLNGPGYTVGEIRGQEFSTPNGTHVEFTYAIIQQFLGYNASAVIDLDGGNPNQFILTQ